MAEANNDFNVCPRKKLEFSEKDKKLITKTLTLILSKTEQEITSFQFDKNIATLYYGKCNCEYFNLVNESIGYDDTEEELNKVQHDLQHKFFN